MMRKNRWLIGILAIVLIYIPLSLFTYKQFGATADEEVEYRSGEALLTYYKTGKNPSDVTIEPRHLPTNSYYFRTQTALMSLLNPKGYYEIYHLLNMFIGLFIFLVMYAFLYYEFLSVKIALLGVVALFLTPRLTGDIPANPKDIPFAFWYFVSIFAIYLLTKEKIKRLYRVLVLGILFGISYAYRFIGISLFPIYFCYTAFLLRPFKLKKTISYLGEILSILLISTLILLPLWPAFKINFPNSMINLIANAKDFKFWDNIILFNGQYLTKLERPQAYLPIWIFITTPLFTLIPFIMSPFISYVSRDKSKLSQLIYIVLITNLLAYFIARPIIYNGLRHFLFLLPPIVLISFITFIYIVKLIRRKSVKLAFVVIAAYAIGIIVSFKDMVLLHPYEYIYFNKAIGGLQGAYKKFDMDYWGASYKEAVEWLRENVSGVPKVYVCNVSHVAQYYSHGKVRIVDKISEAQYIICDATNDDREKFEYPIIYTIAREGVPINIIRKIDDRVSLLFITY